MSAKKGDAAVVGVGVAACAICCAGPIAAGLTAIGVGTAAGIAVFGVVAAVAGVAVAAFVVIRRRRRQTAVAAHCAEISVDGTVPVELSVGRPT